MNNYDIAIIGGGAAGLAAAIGAKLENKGLSVAILERLPRVGKKILSTGNGRCNFTNVNINAGRYRGSCKRYLPTFTEVNIQKFMMCIGVFGAADAEGRVYPLNGCASSVLDGLRLEAKKLGVEEKCGFAAEKIIPGKRFIVASETEEISAKCVILAGGGLSQQALGSDGSAIRLARSLGLKCAPLFPALVPLKTSPAAVKGLKGVRAEATASLKINGKTVRSERGEVQFGENTLSGICIFNLSLWYDEGESAEVVLDLMPDMSDEELFGVLMYLREERGEAAPEDLLTGLLHKRLGLLAMGELAKKPVFGLTDDDLMLLSDRIKNMSFPILGTAGFERSQITRGGILADALNDFLEAVNIPRLFICGEMLDIAGECGGYNLDFAFGSGFFVGKIAAKEVKMLK